MKAAAIKNNPRPLWDLTKEVAPGFIRLTRRGKLVAYVLLASHYDEEDIGYMTDPSFWKMIEQRRKEPTIPLGTGQGSAPGARPQKQNERPKEGQA